MEYRLDPIPQEQSAAQVIAVMDAHFKRPDAKEKNRILQLASQQITAETLAQDKGEAEGVGAADEGFR